jgi:hypothetical protein
MTVTEPRRLITNQLSTDDLVQPGRVNGLAYTDPAVFEAELQRIFTGGWVTGSWPGSGSNASRSPTTARR